MANMADKVVQIALNEVGYLEKKSNAQLDDKTANAGSNNYTKYARDLDNISGFYNGKKNGYPWCDVFTDWCFVQAFGVNEAKELLCQPNNSLGAGCIYSMNYYKNKGQFYSKPSIGDQIFFWNSAKTDIAHTGIVYNVDNAYVYTVEGNTSGASGVIANGGGVCKKKYQLSYSRIAGYGRPKYDGVNNSPIKVPVATPRNYLMKGDAGAEVKKMQEGLIKLGYSCGYNGIADADGIFGSRTEMALKRFQSDNGLTVDGKYGKQTKAKMDALLSKPATSISDKINTVKEVQNWANINYKAGIAVDGIYGVQTKKALIKILQTEINQTYNARLVIDGIWGAKTRAACPTLVFGSKNDVVGVLQALLVCNGYNKAYVDKCYGLLTASAVGEYQRKNRLTVDKMAGKETFAKLCG